MIRGDVNTNKKGLYRQKDKSSLGCMALEVPLPEIASVG